MTAEQIAGLGPAFVKFLEAFRCCFVTVKTFKHLQTYCRGLLSDLARKCVGHVKPAHGCFKPWSALAGCDSSLANAPLCFRART